MRKQTFYFALCFIYLSCKKTEEMVVVIPAAKDIQFKIEQVINDSTIVLKWTRANGNFQKYWLLRSATYLKNGQFSHFVEPVDSSNDANHLSFKESNMPLANNINYELFVSRDTTLPNRGLLRAGYLYYQRPNSLIEGAVTDVLIDKEQQQLYVTLQNKIAIVNYTTGRIMMSKDMPVSIGICALGNFNGSKELYVPVNDGWLHILDAATLQLKDRIYVAGSTIRSVVAVNNTLYVNSSDRSYGIYTIKIYDRATKSLIGRTGYGGYTRLLFLEGTSVEMIDLASRNLYYYQFSPTGVPQSAKKDFYASDYQLDPDMVRSFPDGSKFITSAWGTIFNKSLVFDRYVKEYSNYADFAFNTDGSIIYAADAHQKKIDVVSYPATTIIRNYPTAFYPYKIFRDGNSMICVSKASLSAQGFLMVEKINL
jgi:hypothetical protein